MPQCCGGLKARFKAIFSCLLKRAFSPPQPIGPGSWALAAQAMVKWPFGPPIRRSGQSKSLLTECPHLCFYYERGLFFLQRHSLSWAVEPHGVTALPGRIFPFAPFYSALSQVDHFVWRSVMSIEMFSVTLRFGLLFDTEAEYRAQRVFIGEVSRTLNHHALWIHLSRCRPHMDASSMICFTGVKGLNQDRLVHGKEMNIFVMV